MWQYRRVQCDFFSHQRKRFFLRLAKSDTHYKTRHNVPANRKHMNRQRPTMAVPDVPLRSLELLQRALRHRSADKDNYERLEFLGDRVLELFIADVLFEKRLVCSRKPRRLLCRIALCALLPIGFVWTS